MDIERLRGPSNSARMMLCQDRKSTRLNSSHSQISYAVFCLKKKKKRTKTRKLEKKEQSTMIARNRAKAHAKNPYSSTCSYQIPLQFRIQVMSQILPSLHDRA